MVDDDWDLPADTAGSEDVQELLVRGFEPEDSEYLVDLRLGQELVHHSLIVVKDLVQGDMCCCLLDLYGVLQDDVEPLLAHI